MFKSFCLVAGLSLSVLHTGAMARHTVSPQVDSVVRNGVKSEPLSSDPFIKRYGSLNNFYYRLRHKKEITVAFLGGSITKNPGWRDKVGEYLQVNYPHIHFTFLNAGIPSLGSVPHAYRFSKDVLAHGRADLLFVEAAVNDRGNGTSEVQQRRALEGIVRKALSVDQRTDIILMAFADELKTADYNAGKVPVEVRVHDEVSAKYKLSFINLAEEVTRRIANNEFTWAGDFKNLHPSPFGQEVYSKSISRLLDLEKASSGASKSLKKHDVPPAMDPFSYERAQYERLSLAQALKGFRLDTLWKPADGTRTRAGFSNRPVLLGEAPGDELKLSFDGNATGIAVNAGPDAGIIEYSIDGGTLQEADLFTPWSKSLHLPWYLVLGDGLSASKHTLMIRVKEAKNPKSKGHACRIVHFLLNKSIE